MRSQTIYYVRLSINVEWTSRKAQSRPRRPPPRKCFRASEMTRKATTGRVPPQFNHVPDLRSLPHRGQTRVQTPKPTGLNGTDWRCLGGFRQFRGSYARFSSIIGYAPQTPTSLESARKGGSDHVIISHILFWHFVTPMRASA